MDGNNTCFVGYKWHNPYNLCSFVQAKEEKVETEIDSSTLDNLEKGFALQGAQLKKAQEEILSYQESLRNAYQKIQELYNEMNGIKNELKTPRRIGIS